MRHRQLSPRTGTWVSALCLGTVNVNEAVAEVAIPMIHAALDAGITFIDTADVYHDGSSERLLAQALRGRRDKVVLATKAFGAMGPGENDRGNGRLHLRRACEDSLRRLDTDRIDLYQLHHPDADTPLEETLQGLDELVRAGKILHVGFSNFQSWQIVEALWIADRRQLASGPVTEQPPYNLLDRSVEADIVPACLAHGIGLLPWSPLASGLLGDRIVDGRYTGVRLSAGHPYPDRADWPAGLAAAAALQDVARAAGLTATELALGWLLERPAVTSVIIGPRDQGQLEGCLRALEVQIDADTRAAVDAATIPGGAVFRM